MMSSKEVAAATATGVLCTLIIAAGVALGIRTADRVKGHDPRTLEVMVDIETSCHYLITGTGGVTKRTASTDGQERHMGCKTEPSESGIKKPAPFARPPAKLRPVATTNPIAF